MVIEQRIGRLHRFGKEHEVEVFNLCARGPMEERILGVLHDRVRLFFLPFAYNPFRVLCCKLISAILHLDKGFSCLSNLITTSFWPSC